STYFGWIGAAAGLSGALGTTLGGFLAEHWMMGGLLGLFIVSSLCRLVALCPLFFVRERRTVSLQELIKVIVDKAVDKANLEPLS
ncbi:MAG TPA: hypothetical protein V6D19_26190, partial [Stenomitos sp.]